MKKITQDAANAFMRGKEFRRGNTEVKTKIFRGAVSTVELVLHGSVIARRDNTEGGGSIEVTDAGYPTVTTKRRLNGIPGVSIYQRKGDWYLNGEEWDGEWTTVEGGAS